MLANSSKRILRSFPKLTILPMMLFALFATLAGSCFAQGSANLGRQYQAPSRSQFSNPKNVQTGRLPFLDGRKQTPEPKQTLPNRNLKTKTSGPFTATNPSLRYFPGSINAITFSGPENGIAVGDQGMIWRTTDGGQRWTPVRSGTLSNLYAATYLDPQTIVVGGGHSLPIKNLHKGVVLKSANAGKTWKVIDRTYLPRVTGIKKSGTKSLLVSTNGDLRNLLGIYQSVDGGGTWSPMQTDLTIPLHRWNSKNGYRPNIPVLTRDLTSHAFPGHAKNRIAKIGSHWIAASGQGVYWGSVNKINKGKIVSKVNVQPVFDDLHFVRPTECWAIDQFGKLWSSRDRGRTWRLHQISVTSIAADPTTNLVPNTGGQAKGQTSRTAQQQKPFSRILVKGQFAWLPVANSPEVVKVNLRTMQATLSKLPIPTPPKAMFFLDEKLGWAAGDLGSIARTQDGGRSWQYLHRSFKKTTVLMVARSPEDIPAELLSKLAADQSQVVAILTGWRGNHFFRNKDAFSLQGVASWIVDANCFSDVHGTIAQEQSLADWIKRLKPQVVLACPRGNWSTSRSQIPGPAMDPMRVATACGNVLKAERYTKAKNRIRQIQVAILCPTSTAQVTFSPNTYSERLQQTYTDFCVLTKSILHPIGFDVNSTNPPKASSDLPFGIRTLAGAGNMDLSWFQASNENKKWLSRPNRSLNSRHVGQVALLTRKNAWLSFMRKLPNKKDVDRTKFMNQIRSIQQIPAPLFSKWIHELSLSSDNEGKQLLAALAAVEAWDRSENAEYCLTSILPALETILSDEMQWRQSLQIRRKLEQEQRLARQEAMKDKDPKSVERRLFQKYGINPEDLSTVPADVREKIMMMEDALAGDRKALEAYRKMVSVPQPVLSVSKSIQRTQLGQNFNETSIDWNRPLQNQPQMTLQEAREHLLDQLNTIQNSGVKKAEKTILDRPKNIRSKLVNRIVKQIEYNYPQIGGYPKWWLIKSACQKGLGEKDTNYKVHKKLHRLLLSHGYRKNSILNPVEGPGLHWTLVQQTFTGPDFTGKKLTDLISNGKSKAGVLSVTYGRPENGISTLPAAKILNAPFASQPPLLDGVFGDQLWNSPFKPGYDLGGGPSIQVSTCNDDQYLYLAVQTTGPSIQPASFINKAKPQPNGGSFARDQSRSSEAIEICLDVDGDHLKPFRIVLDQEGGTVDLAGSDSGWNPELYVARKKMSAGTTCYEIAIRLEDLTATANDHPWLLSVNRRSRDQRKKLGHWWMQINEPAMDFDPEDLDQMFSGGSFSEPQDSGFPEETGLPVAGRKK